MKSLVVLFLLVAASAPVRAGEDLSWAYPKVPPHTVDPSPALFEVPGSALRFTHAQIDGGYEVADWYPTEHPAMPRIVANGSLPPVRACAMCHLPSGNGHPESAGLAGLPVAYTLAQMRAYVDGTRTGSRAASMVPIASSMSDEELLASAEYFAALKPTVWTQVIEAETVPQTRLGLGAVRYRQEGDATEPLGRRIISLPEDDARAELRDSHSGFVEFVPPGSIARGKALVDRSSNGINCASCHGPALAGVGDVPGLPGRLAMVLFRGLHDIGNGHRKTDGSLAMKAALPGLSTDDEIAIAAYLASLPPQ